MKFFTVSIQKVNNTFTSNMYQYNSLDKAKAKAYSELTAGYTKAVDLCSVAVIDEMHNNFLKEFVSNDTTEEETAE